MKLLVTTDAVGGVWVYSVELARALKNFGVEAILAVMGPSPTRRQQEDASDLQLIDTGLPLEWLDTTPAAVRNAGNEIAWIAGYVGADIVQTSSAALLADTAFEQPSVAVQHSCVATWWHAVKRTPLPAEFEWRRELVRRGLTRASAIVAPSLAFAEETARTYDLQTTVDVVHNGRRMPGFTDLAHGEFVFTASRLWDEGKNVATLDAAAALLEAPFQAAGPTTGPNGTAIRLDHVQPLGELSGTRLAALLAARPVYASAAVYEPFGLSVLEAAQAGCALVLSDILTHREIWGGAAIFVPARDSAAFANAIDDLLNDPEKRWELGRLARARAWQFSPERMAARMADIYAALTADAAPIQLAGAA